MQARTLKLYIDYKSPYAYLAKDPAYRLELDTGVEIDWLPYILDIPAYLGSAQVDAEALKDVLKRAGADVSGFDAFLEGEGRRELQAVQEAAEASGVFGVPSFLLADGDLYWGREHLPRIREILAVH